MAFDSLKFMIFFLPLTILLFYVIGKAGKKNLVLKFYLLLCSLVYYRFYGRKALLILLVFMLCNYALSLGIRRHAGGKIKRLYLALGIVVNAGYLLTVKYYLPCADLIAGITKGRFMPIELLVPAGISFFVFKQITFLADIYGKNEGCSFLDYAVYSLFFPQITMGPIQTWHEFEPELNKEELGRFNWKNFYDGSFSIAAGLIKKVLLADTLAGFADLCFDGWSSSQNGLVALLGMIAYSLQLYYDFSGYSDMAIGISRLMNIAVDENFNSPYKAVSISDFWDRWHISLTRFLTRYVYIPLGGSRRGALRTYINIMAVFLISGIWHGSEWKFIVWGLLHGLFMVAERLLSRSGIKNKVPSLLRRIYTFLLVSFLWLFFRARDMAGAFGMAKAVFVKKYDWLEPRYATPFIATDLRYLIDTFRLSRVEQYIPYVFIMAALLIALFLPNRRQMLEKQYHLKKGIAVGYAFLTVYAVISMTKVREFFYLSF